MRQADTMGGGFGGFRGQLTAVGRWLVYYYGAALVLGLLITHWTEPPFNEVILRALLNPIGADVFAPWQLLTHVFVVYPLAQNIFSFLIQMFVFWLFAWQVEVQVGTRIFITLVLAVPLVSGVLGIPFTFIPLFQAPFAGFEVWIDVLLVAYYMLNRNSTGLFMFAIPLKLIHLIYFDVGLQLLFFLARSNPQLHYHLLAMALTWIFFRFWVQRHGSGGAGRRGRDLERRRPNIMVIPGGGGRDSDPLYH